MRQTPGGASEADLRQANEAFDQAINARDEAWDRCNQCTLGETERAKNGWRHLGEKAPQ